MLASVFRNEAVPVAGMPVVAVPPAPKNMPLTAALDNGLRLVTRTITCPLRLHTKYWPPMKFDTERLSSTVLLASTMSTLSERP